MTLKILIIGAGPAGCYVAQSLRKALPECELTIMDRLPVPYGLVRYGVAPDHQGTKAVIKQFARLFERQEVNFIGNVEMGCDINLKTLRDMFDIVVLATGLSKDKSLGPDFAALSYVYGAGQVTRAWNGHPDEADFAPQFGTTAIIIGNGNVAMDIARLMAKGPDDFVGSDIFGKDLTPDIKTIHLVGRSSARAAKFDPSMVRELAKLNNLNVALGEGSILPDDPNNKLLVALSDLVDLKPNNSAKSLVKSLVLHFGLSVTAPNANNGVLGGVVFDRDGEEFSIRCDSLVSAIGFDDDGKLDRSRLLDNAINHETGHLAQGLYTAGWFRRGPRGTIPENRTDAQSVARQIIADLNGKVNGDGKSGIEGLRAAYKNQYVSYESWLEIDKAEIAQAAPDRVRQKLLNRQDMLAVISKA